MKIGIIGTGGVGGYFGGKLAKSGNDVTFLARGEHLKELKAKGLTIRSYLGDFHVHPVKATDSLKEIGSVDLAIIAVKAWQLADIAKELAGSIGQDTLILPLQNGISAIDELKERIVSDGIIGGTCFIMSKIESSGVITHFGVEPTIVFGEVDKTRSVRCVELLNVFTDAGIRAAISTDIVAELWKKFIVVCIGGLLAVTRATYGELRALNETRRMMISILEEGYRLSQVLNIDIDTDFINRSIRTIDALPYGSTASLTRDVWNGKPSEIDYQNGTVVKLSRQHLVSTPVNEFVYNCILPMEIKARRK